MAMDDAVRVTEPDEVQFGQDGLVPAVVQDAVNGQVLMLAYMDREALGRTLRTGETWFWSRSRQAYWHKGETSGHIQRVRGVWADCDRDALLVEVEQVGAACHEGDRTCFHRPLTAAAGSAAPAAPSFAPQDDLGRVLAELEEVIEERRRSSPEESYVRRLLDRAPDAVCKKVGEEATEVVLASKNADLENLVWEAADLWFHTLVLLHHHGLSSRQVAAELRRRRH